MISLGIRFGVSLLVLVLHILFILPGPAVAEPPRVIVATTGMIADLVGHIVSGRAEVRGLMGPGVDPHLYRLTRSDMGLLGSADAIFYNGLLLEGKMTDALVRLATGGRKVFAVTQGLDPEQLLFADGDAGNHYDPHIWMDPTVWAKAADLVSQKLSDIDPAGSFDYRKNAASYKAKLKQLDHYIHTSVATVPEQSKVLITAHDAFSYFGRRYGIDVIGIQGISTESEAGVRDIRRIVRLIVERKLPAVFVETSVPDRNVIALIQGARAEGHEVRLGGTLYSDAMGSPGTYEGTYIGMLDHNATTIVNALGGQAPPRGMNGMLAEQRRP